MNRRKLKKSSANGESSFPVGVEYKDPPQLATLRKDFIESQSAPSLHRSAILLDELAFSDISIEDFLAKHVHGNVSTANPAFTVLKKSLEDVAKVSTGESSAEEIQGRPLNNAIVQHLYLKWDKLRELKGLSPNNVNAGLREIKRKKDELLASPAGGLLAAVLYSANSRVIEIAVDDTFNKGFFGVESEEQVHRIAHKHMMHHFSGMILPLVRNSLSRHISVKGWRIF